MTDEYKRLVQTRGFLRQQITKHHQNIQDGRILASYPVLKKQQLIAKLKSISTQISDLNSNIQSLAWDPLVSGNEAKHATELDQCDTYLDKLLESIAALENGLLPSQGSSPNQSQPHLKAPTAPLPKFDSGEHESLEKFFYNFEAVVNRYNYSDYEKFIFMKQQISGRALLLIDSLEASNQSYTEAKDLLNKALASPLSQKYDAIQRLNDLSLPYTKDPYAFVSEIRIITESFKSLKIDIDFILQFFIWRSMNDTLQNQFIQLTNENRPSLKEIDKHMFAAVERYLMVTKKFNERKNKQSSSKPADNNSKTVRTMAASVEYKPKQGDFRACVLCTTETCNADHPIYKCSTYKTPEEKISRIGVLKGCERCANLNHSTSDCRFRFNTKCRSCMQWHFSFLCEKSKVPKDKPKSDTTSKLVWNESLLQSSTNEKSLLPTFSCRLNNLTIRGLKDSGSQSNFILESVANEHKLEVVEDDIPLRIHGINATKEYKTKLVKLPLKFKDSSQILQAVCIPEINIELKLPCLDELILEYSKRGFNFADQFLLNDGGKINNIKLIMGTESAHCLPETEMLFGNPTPSVYSETPIGILLKGNSSRMLRNMKYLKPCKLMGTTSFSIRNEVTLAEGNPKNDLKIKKSQGKYPESKKFVNNIPVISQTGEIIESRLQEAVESILKADHSVLNDYCSSILNHSEDKGDESCIETNESLIKFVLDNTKQEDDGRLIMPLTWKAEASHLLGKNYVLAKQILQSNLKKLSKNRDRLLMTDQVFKDQENDGIIERLPNLSLFMAEHPECSFLPHMSVFKLNKETSKCRVVYLSNLCERDKSRSLTLSHNQVIHPGPNLNKKLSTALLHLRFDKYLLCFDLKKAFLQIALNEVDQNRLLFLWYKNVSRDNFEVVGYRTKRLPFGIPCSPSILMLAMYKILIVDASLDTVEVRNLKKLIYHLIYMDNGCYSCNSEEELHWAFRHLKEIFDSYQFELQQFVTNCSTVRDNIEVECEEKSPEAANLFGLIWDNREDTLSTKPARLNKDANTKRLILQSIAQNFDLFGFSIPILNRSRLFMQQLQSTPTLKWDDMLPDLQLKEWKNIANQVNLSGNIKVKRFMGKRSSSYRLFAFTDASKHIYGTVIFIQDVENLEVSFLLSKNRLVSKNLEHKSIPSLEFQALVLGAQTLAEIVKELKGADNLFPIKVEDVHLFTDSMVSLSWVNSHVNKFDKTQQKRSVFINNRLNSLMKICEEVTITFSFCSGFENPADIVTRPVSYKQLSKSNYFVGPSFLKNSIHDAHSREDILKVTIPNPCLKLPNVIEAAYLHVRISLDLPDEHLVALTKYSSFNRVLGIHVRVFQFINHLKVKLKEKKPEKYKHLNCLDADQNYFELAHKWIIRRDQEIHYGDCFEYFKSQGKNLKDIPNIISQLNVYEDRDGILRVKSKCGRGEKRSLNYFPVLLSKNSDLTNLITQNLHIKLNHAGCYTLLSNLRKQFWIPQIFSYVKSILQECVVCKRFNNRPIKVNQNQYRDFRINPPNVPFRYVFLDHLGPYTIKLNNQREKIWLVCFTCLWSRAVNLKICLDLSTASFLRAFQMHCYEYGMPELVLSDLGSQIVSASNVVLDFLKDMDTQRFLQENHIKSPKFDQYYKGNSSLGSLVESCVKMVKRLIYGSIRNNVLSYFEFEFVIAETVHLINKRPIAFKESLRANRTDDLPEVITPEHLLKGHDLVTVNMIPELQPRAGLDPAWSANPVSYIKDNFSKLRGVRENLIDIYNGEFLSTLITQATDQRDRYKPVKHARLQIGDIVLLKEKHFKPSAFPMGMVTNLQVNAQNEVTGATVMKGKNRELVKRHVNSLIPLVSAESRDNKLADSTEISMVQDDKSDEPSSIDTLPPGTRPTRKTAGQSAKGWKQLIDEGLI